MTRPCIHPPSPKVQALLNTLNLPEPTANGAVLITTSELLTIYDLLRWIVVELARCGELAPETP